MSSSAGHSNPAVEKKARAAIDLEGLTQCLSALLQIPSVSGTPDENGAQRWFAERLRENDFEVDLWDIPIQQTVAHPDFPGWEVDRSEALGLVGAWGGDRGPTLILNGHIDVVPPGDLTQWDAQNAYSGKRTKDEIFGRGACDMKGGLVCNLFAVKAIQAAGIKLKGRVLIQSVVGEEDGGLGTFATLLRGHKGDAAIIPEPTDLAIIPACAGALTFRLKLVGRSTHASVRLEGVSALEKFWKVWDGLQALESRRNSNRHPLMTRHALPYPLSIGTVKTGDWPSSVPDLLLAEGRLGVALGESPQAAREDLERCVAEVCAQDPWLKANPVQVDWFGGQFASGSIPEDHPLIGLVSGIHQDLQGTPPAIHGAPYGSDLRLMVGLGHIPTLHYGPGNVKRAHAPNEGVPISHLRATTEALALAIIRFCGVQ